MSIIIKKNRSHPPHPHCTTTTTVRARAHRERSADQQGKKGNLLMAIVSGGNGGGRLNPWAQPFVPSGVRYRGLQTPAPAAEQEEVEDFSPEWWRLVAASPAFRDRWLRDYERAMDDDVDDAEVDSFLPDDLVSPPALTVQEGGRDEDATSKTRHAGSRNLEVAAWGIDKWWRTHGSPPEVPRYAEKAPRKVAGSARVSPRPIQQPR